MTDSIEIPYWFYLSLIQVAILLFVMFLIFLMRFKKSKLEIKTLQTSLESLNKSDKTSELKTRINSLEKFRDRYFAVKQQYENLLSIYAELEEKIKNEFDKESQDKLQDILNQLTLKKSELESKLKSIEIELGFIVEIETDNLEDQAKSPEYVDDNITNIKNIISEQKSLISELNEQISQLTTEANEKEALQESLASLEAQFNELLDAIEVLQDENEFLQDQIQALLKQENQTETKYKHEIDVLKTHLADKNTEYDELHQKFTQIEAEYLKLEDEHSKSKD